MPRKTEQKPLQEKCWASTPVIWERGTLGAQQSLHSLFLSAWWGGTYPERRQHQHQLLCSCGAILPNIPQAFAGERRQPASLSGPGRLQKQYEAPQFHSLKAVYSRSSFHLASWKGQSDNFTTAQIVQQLSRNAKKWNQWLLTPHPHKTPGWVWSRGCMSRFYFASWVRMLGAESCILQLLQGNCSLVCQSSGLFSNPVKHHKVQLRGKVQIIPLDFPILLIS